MPRSCPRCARLYASDQQFCPQDGATLDNVAASDPRLGLVLAGRFRIQELLGSGGMGCIYRAEQLPIGRSVAVKVLRRDRLDDAEAGERFLREAKAISRLKSPHTVTLYDYGEREGAESELFLVMEHLVGQTLRDRLRAVERLSVRESLTIADQIARSLAEAHAIGIVHRDLKPANIFLVEAPTYPTFVKVLDFGVATLEPGPEEQIRLTTTSQLPGAPAYLAPERIHGEEAGPAADIYAIGVMLYEMLAGARPFSGATPAEVFTAAIQNEPRPLEEACPGLSVPTSVRDLIWSCLAKSPRLRPHDAEALRVALARALGGLDATGPAATLTSPDLVRSAPAACTGAPAFTTGPPSSLSSPRQDAARRSATGEPKPPRARWDVLPFAAAVAIAAIIGYLAGRGPAPAALPAEPVATPIVTSAAADPIPTADQAHGQARAAPTPGASAAPDIQVAPVLAAPPTGSADGPTTQRADVTPTQDALAADPGVAATTPGAAARLAPTPPPTREPGLSPDDQRRVDLLLK